MHYLEATIAADPNHPYALRPLADFYALSILERGPLAARAQTGLEASKNIWVLGNAAYMLQSQYNRRVQIGAPNPRDAELPSGTSSAPRLSFRTWTGRRSCRNSTRKRLRVRGKPTNRPSRIGGHAPRRRSARSGVSRWRRSRRSPRLSLEP